MGVVLASASPRRLELLRSAGLDPVVRPAGVDETPRAGEDAAAYVARVARAKALAIERTHGEVVLGADTTVVLDGELLGKPVDPASAAATLRRLSGRTHTVTTAIAVVAAGGAVLEDVVSTDVTFTDLAEAAITAYAATAEPLDKAGAYGIQGRAAAFVARVDGSYTNVVGLPLFEALRLLRRGGATLPAIGAGR